MKRYRSIKDFLWEAKPMTPTDWLVDCVIAAGAFGFGLLQLTLSVNLFVPDDFMRRILGIYSVVPSALAIITTLLLCLPLIFRRKLPWVTFGIIWVLWLGFQWYANLFSLSPVSLLVALFTVAYERGNGEALLAGAIALLGVLAIPGDGGSQTLASLMLFQNSSFVIAATLAGYAFHTRQEYLEAVLERAAEAERREASEAARAQAAERTRESEASRRVEEERVRIARELHDITAHSLSAVSIQAAAAERLVDGDPEAAKESMRVVRTTAKDSLDEIRALVGVLRSEGEEAQTTPMEGTERLEDLARYLSQDGIEACFDLSGYDRTAVPAYIDLALFGIAREAVTNIARHAGASAASLTLLSDGRRIILTVDDDGCGFEGSIGEEDSGHGLVGMRERVHLLGGDLETGKSTLGGFRIKATIPLMAERGQA